MIKLAVIGYPISHSKSPIIHTSVMNELKLEYDYNAVEVREGELSAFVDRVKAENIDGFNITMPHKIDIMQYLDEIDIEAKRYNSVNTVRYKDGKLYGYNTDADGYVMSLKEAGTEFKDRDVLILGAGGVVNTLSLKAVYEGAKSVTVLNRSIDKAEKVCEYVKQETGKELKFASLETKNICDNAQNCDIIINATPLGMHGIDADFEDFSFFENLKSGAVVSDLIYNPEETNFLRNARLKGFKNINGLGMLIYQALIADRIYTETDFDLIDMKKKIYDKVK